MGTGAAPEPSGGAGRRSPAPRHAEARGQRPSEAPEGSNQEEKQRDHLFSTVCTLPVKGGTHPLFQNFHSWCSRLHGFQMIPSQA